MAHTETFIRGETVYQGPDFSLRHDVVRLEDGRESRREIIQKPDKALVLLLHGGACRVERLWRSAIGRESLELPAAALAPGEAPARAAQRLLARWGLGEVALRSLGAVLPSPGILQAHTYVFFGTTAQPCAGEAMAVQALLRFLDTGAIADMNTAAALGLARLQGLLGEVPA